MRLIHRHLRALALQSTSPPLSFSLSLCFLTLHLLALLAVCRVAHWPLWLAPLLLVIFCLPQLLLRRRWIESLAPLFGAYGLAGLRLFIVYVLRQEASPVLSYGWAVALSALWMGLIWLRMLRRLRHAWLALGLSAAAFLVYLLWLNRPAGVTGSDPFAYVQMGLDLALRGTPRHAFPLAPFAASLGLPTLPITHVGYVLPNAQGLAPTVWPPGYSALLALAYRLAGEGGMLSLNVWIGLLNLILTLWLTILLCPPRWRRLPVLIGAGALALLATSLEQFTRLVVPLADGAAQAFTTLGVCLVLLVVRPSPIPPRLHTPILLGLCLAAAYSIRYTQLLIAPGVVLLAWFGLRDAKERFRFLAPFALAACLGALPDSLYRTYLYGAPWRFGTGELALFSVRALPEAIGRLSAELFAPAELGWLWPLALLGAVYLWRRNRMMLLSLGVIYGPLLLFHVWYPFLKLRDLLSLYPPLVALGAIGGAALLLALWRRGTPARLLVIVGLFTLGLVRLAPMLSLTKGVYTFGYLYPEQRQSFESLAALTEPEAVIACSLNSGAVELYGQHVAVRPGNQLQPGASWSGEQWLGFVAALRAQGRSLYLLMDSPEMDAPLAALRGHYSLTHVADLDVPVFFVGGGSRNLSVPLYRVEP